MEKVLYTEDSISWLPSNTLVEVCLSNILPPLELCTSVDAVVISDGMLLQADLREGERPERQLDVPGGHFDEGEDPETAVAREVFEETGVRVKVIKLAGYKKITIRDSKPDGWKYPYPTSYMLFYICQVVEETPYEGNHEVHGRVWLSPDEYIKSKWYVLNKNFADALIAESVNLNK